MITWSKLIYYFYFTCGGTASYELIPLILSSSSMSSLLEKLTLDVLIFCETIYPFKNYTQIKYYSKQKVSTKHDVWCILKRALPEILVQGNFWKSFILFGEKNEQWLVRWKRQVWPVQLYLYLHKVQRIRSQFVLEMTTMSIEVKQPLHKKLQKHKQK